MKYGNYQENFDKNVLLSKSPGNTPHVVTIFNNILFALSATFSSSLHLSHHSAVFEAKNYDQIVLNGSIPFSITVCHRDLVHLSLHVLLPVHLFSK
jgi:hypothetical protein